MSDGIPLSTPVIDAAYRQEDAVRWNTKALEHLQETWGGTEIELARRAIKMAAARQAVVGVVYVGFDGRPHLGQMVIDRSLAHLIAALFEELRGLSFPIRQVVPVFAFDFDDALSMRADNSSGFNPRLTSGRLKRLSNHSLGLAFDINPVENPYVENYVDDKSQWRTEPAGSTYDIEAPGTITPSVASIVKAYGFTWGGDWPNARDFQHFDFDIDSAAASLRRLSGDEPVPRVGLRQELEYFSGVKALRGLKVLSA